MSNCCLGYSEAEREHCEQWVVSGPKRARAVTMVGNYTVSKAKQSTAPISILLRVQNSPKDFWLCGLCFM
jgi:hypothetical protein